MSKCLSRWATLVALNVACLGVLGFYRSTDAAPRSDNQPFANAVEQRMEMIRELKQMNALLREQNALLRSGKLQVVVTLPQGS